MALFDVTKFKASEEVAKLLGFSRMLTLGREVTMGQASEAGKLKNMLVDFDKSQGISSVVKALKNQDVLGIATGFGARIEQKVMSELAQEEKALVINAGTLMCAERERLSPMLGSAPAVFARAKNARLKIGIASFAESESCLASSKQLIYLATLLLGASEPEAKQMLGFWSDLL